MLHLDQVTLTRVTEIAQWSETYWEFLFNIFCLPYDLRCVKARATKIEIANMTIADINNIAHGDIPELFTPTERVDELDELFSIDRLKRSAQKDLEKYAILSTCGIKPQKLRDWYNEIRQPCLFGEVG